MEQGNMKEKDKMEQEDMKEKDKMGQKEPQETDKMGQEYMKEYCKMVLEGQARKVQDGIGQELIGGHKGMYGQRGMKDTDK